MTTKPIERTHCLDYDVCQCDWIVEKIRNNDVYAQHFYAALCNQEWYEKDVWALLQDHTWSCSWRYAGGVVADIRGEGSYLDWYCSGMSFSHPVQVYVPEGTVTEEIEQDLAQIGWYPIKIDE